MFIIWARTYAAISFPFRVFGSCFFFSSFFGVGSGQSRERCPTFLHLKQAPIFIRPARSLVVMESTSMALGSFRGENVNFFGVEEVCAVVLVWVWFWFVFWKIFWIF